MTDLVIFPDAVSVVKAILDDGYVNVPVADEVPTPRPASFVKLIRTGGKQGNMVSDRAQIAVESWASNRDDAHDLAQLCRGLIHRARATVVDSTVVYGVVEVSGPGDLPDTLSDQHRFTQTFEVSCRGVAITPPGPPSS